MTSTAILLGDTFGKSHPLTSVHEDYLKSIYLLHSKGTKVTNSALANYLNITPASATNMVKKLAEWELITYEPYQSILLTEMGQPDRRFIRDCPSQTGMYGWSSIIYHCTRGKINIKKTHFNCCSAHSDFVVELELPCNN